jgi:paraquat-inducible protein A
LQTACPHCDHFVELTPLGPEEAARCPYCKTTLQQGTAQRNQTIIASCIAGIIAMICSLLFPFISLNTQGFSQSVTLLQAGEILLQFKEPLLAALFNLTTIGIPLLLLFLLIPLHTKLFDVLPYQFQKPLLKFTLGLQPWIMSEIFLIGVLVSLVKITSMADVEMGMSFWAFCMFVALFIYSINLVDKHHLWNRVKPTRPIKISSLYKRAIDHDINACSKCHVLHDAEKCPRCGHAAFNRQPESMQRVIALLLTATIMYIPANFLPILTSETLYQVTESTIMGGVIILWKQESYPIASIIFIASILIPLLKILLLGWLCLVVKGYTAVSKNSHTKIYHMIELIGKWSMLDIFVVAISVALVQLGQLMTVTPGPGALFFAGVVIASMLAAQQFDSRLLWDEYYKKKNHDKKS